MAQEQKSYFFFVLFYFFFLPMKKWMNRLNDTLVVQIFLYIFEKRKKKDHKQSRNGVKKTSTIRLS